MTERTNTGGNVSGTFDEDEETDEYESTSRPQFVDKLTSFFSVSLLWLIINR